MRSFAAVSGFALLAAAFAGAQIVPGYTVEDYAFVTDPVSRSFMPDGTLYVGRDNAGSGGSGGDAVRIHQIGPGGAPVQEWGAAPIEDPDAVLADPLGLFAPAGSVLVGGSNVGLGGGVRAILPDQSIIDVFAPNLAVVNPNSLQFDQTNRLLIGEDRVANTRVLVSNGGPLTTLIDLPGFGGFTTAVGSNDIYTNVGGTVAIYDQNGVLLNPAFTVLAGGGGLAFGPGNALWGDDLYTLVRSTGELIRIDEFGVQTVIGTGFGSQTFGPSFGPDGFMYFSVFDGDKVIRIVPEPASAALLLIGGLLARRRRA